MDGTMRSSTGLVVADAAWAGRERRAWGLGASASPGWRRCGVVVVVEDRQDRQDRQDRTDRPGQARTTKLQSARASSCRRFTLAFGCPLWRAWPWYMDTCGAAAYMHRRYGKTHTCLYTEMRHPLPHTHAPAAASPSLARQQRGGRKAGWLRHAYQHRGPRARPSRSMAATRPAPSLAHTDTTGTRSHWPPSICYYILCLRVHDAPLAPCPS